MSESSPAMGHDRVSVRLGLSCEMLGLPTPPQEFHLRFLAWSQGWSLAVWSSEPCTPEQVRTWAAGLAPDHMRATREGERAHWFGAVQVPPPLLGLLTEFRVTHLRVQPDGQASLSLEGDAPAIRTLLDQARFDRTRTVAEFLPRASEEGLLTERQSRALEYAAASGYYRIPRPVNLRALARDMGITSAALSELLRRAEASVILDFLARQGRERVPAPEPERMPPPATDG